MKMMRFNNIGLFSLLMIPKMIYAKEVVYEWAMNPEIDNIFSPDCMNLVTPRRLLSLVDESLPGPTIDVQENDTVRVILTNHDPASTISLHWHGLHQNSTTVYSDGPVFVTQCPLGPFQTQEYVFKAYPPGTHYWHAHASYHHADGMNGALIVRPLEAEPFTYDEERIVYIQDWYIETGTQQLVGLNSWPFVWIGNPNSILINGKGIAPECDIGGVNYNNSDICLDTCMNDPSELLSIINVEAGKTYRLRLINAGQLVMVNFAITGHSLTIVQTEGTSVEPVVVESIDIAPGQRYDLLLTADQNVDNYWIETTVRERNIEDVIGRAILRYDGAPTDESPQGESPAHPGWDNPAFGEAQDDSLKTLDTSKHPENLALSATNVTRYILVGTQNQVIVNGEPELLRWAVNNVSRVHGHEPLIGPVVRSAKELGWPTTIEDTMDMTTTPPTTWDYTNNVGTEFGGPGPALGYQSESIIQLKEGDVFEFVLQNARALNDVAEFHPWHAHGHSFWVVGRGEGIYDPTTDVDIYNLINPVLRDTVTVWPLNWVAIRFVANNPGVWYFHCHILSHEVMGMGFVMVVQPDMLDDPSESVASCSSDSLLPGSGGEGDDDDDDGSKDDTSSSSSLGMFVGSVSITIPLIMLVLFAW